MWEFTLEGTGEFPLTVLRAHQAWPASRSDEGAIYDSLVTDKRHGGPRLRSVRIRSALGPPLAQQWAFTWTLTSSVQVLDPKARDQPAEEERRNA